MKKSMYILLIVATFCGTSLSVRAAELGRIEILMNQLFTTYDMSNIAYVAVIQDNYDPVANSKIVLRGCRGVMAEIYETYLTEGGSITYSEIRLSAMHPRTAVVAAKEQTTTPIVAQGLFAQNSSELWDEDGMMWIWRNQTEIICPGDGDVKYPTIPGKGSDTDTDADREEFMHEVQTLVEGFGGGKRFEEDVPEMFPEDAPIPELVPNYQLPAKQDLVVQSSSVGLAIIVLALLFLGSIFLVVRLRSA